MDHGGLKEEQGCCHVVPCSCENAQGSVELHLLIACAIALLCVGPPERLHDPDLEGMGIISRVGLSYQKIDLIVLHVCAWPSGISSGLHSGKHVSGWL